MVSGFRKRPCTRAEPGDHRYVARVRRRLGFSRHESLDDDRGGEPRGVGRFAGDHRHELSGDGYAERRDSRQRDARRSRVRFEVCFRRYRRARMEIRQPDRPIPLGRGGSAAVAGRAAREFDGDFGRCRLLARGTANGIRSQRLGDRAREDKEAANRLAADRRPARIPSSRQRAAIRAGGAGRRDAYRLEAGDGGGRELRRPPDVRRQDGEHYAGVSSVRGGKA